MFVEVLAGAALGFWYTPSSLATLIFAAFSLGGVCEVVLVPAPHRSRLTGTLLGTSSQALLVIPRSLSGTVRGFLAGI